MTIHEAIEVVNQITLGKHRPAISIRAASAFEGTAVRVLVKLGPLVNAETGNDDGRCIEQSHFLSEYDRSMVNEQTLVLWARRAIMDMIAHEVDEWLRFKGERLHDPHPERGRA